MCYPRYGSESKISEVKTILLLGPSNLAYSEGDAEASILAMVPRELEAATGERWRCEARFVTYGRRMAEFAERHAREVRPDVIVLNLIQAPFLLDMPLAVVRRRWPRIYPRARALAERLRAAAGGRDVRTARGWLYRLPRQLLLLAVGGEPEIAVEDAIGCSTETLDRLLRMEECALVCGFYMLPERATGRAANLYEQRVGLFRTRVGDYCREHHIQIYDLETELNRHSRTYDYSTADRLYPDLPTRRFQTDLVVDYVTRAMSEVVSTADAPGRQAD